MKTTPEPQPDFADIQGIVGTGFANLPQCRYLLLHIRDAAAARGWLSEVLDSGLVKSVADLDKRHEGALEGARRQQHPEAAMLSFSHDGLVRLGVQRDDDQPFPSAFCGGMACVERERLFGDEPHRCWDWGDTALPGDTRFQAHMLVAHYWRDEPALPTLFDPQALRGRFAEVRVITTCPSYFGDTPAGRSMVEPFGFRDGIGQPVLRGFPRSRAEHTARQAAGELFEDRLIAVGEFVLGHLNEYGEQAYCPGAADWTAADGPGRFAHNGSYLVARHIRQFVDTFRAFERGSSIPDVAAKMMGRQLDGRPLVKPTLPTNGTPDPDAFRYLVADANGFQCPRGAHARRANPRDAMARDEASGIASSKLHRLLRRGRVYANDCVARKAGTKCDGDSRHRDGQCGKGLLFLALNADLDRQFEFVQSQWLGGSRFGDLSDERDPILGTAPDRAFTVQGLPVGKRIGPLPRFTKVLGGGYFFVPGLKALRFISRRG
jgi:putative iron-dependent peroxidase